ncbi:tripartite motif-containing protein 45-like [Crassostrea angulata]|uniref:tripartite motif-containing protein 45-like n=1 Tax=Magallana angulata TaxID=2784310 RepID=UPI0022B207A3|nr:tripartite motif-containing protein 45-like [Crassostrea angulata]
MDSEFAQQDIVRCDLCDTPVPDLHCDLCEINLCQSCGEEHLLDKSKRHQVVSFKQRRSTFKRQICQRHSTQGSNWYCELCDSLLCEECISSEEHQGHTFITSQENFERKYNQIKNDLQELEQSIYPSYQEIASHVTKQKANLPYTSQKMINDIGKQGDDWHNVINQLTEKLKSDVHELKTNFSTALNNHEEFITKKMHEIEQLILHLKNILDVDDIDPVSAYKSKNETVRRFPKIVKIPFQSFTALEINKDQINQQFGFLSGKPYPIEVNLSLPDDLQAFEKETISMKSLLKEPLTKATICTDYVGHLNGLRSVVCLNDDKIWSSGMNNIISLYNLQGDLLTSVRTKSGKRPTGIAVTNTGDLVYTDEDDKTINIVRNKKIEVLIKFHDWRPLNVCSTPFGNLLVLMGSDDYEQTKVVRYSGSTEKQCIQNDENGKAFFSPDDSKYLAVNRNQDICVADYRAKRVVVISATGKLRFTYTGSTPNTIESFDPVGITTDSLSRILIADGHCHYIHIIDQDGQFLRYIDNLNLRGPWGLCIDTNDNLFVAECDLGKIEKIQYCATTD